MNVIFLRLNELLVIIEKQAIVYLLLYHLDNCTFKFIQRLGFGFFLSEIN